MEQTFRVPAWLADAPDPSPGILAMSVDSVLGSAVLSTLTPGQMPITMSLRLDAMGRRPEPGELVINRGRIINGGGKVQIATGEMFSEDGTLLATSTIRCLVISVDPSARPSYTETSKDTSTESVPARSESSIGDTSDESSNGASEDTQRTVPKPDWVHALLAPQASYSLETATDMRNGNAMVHGGIISLLLERSTHGAAAQLRQGSDSGSEPTLSALTIDYLSGLSIETPTLGFRADVISSTRNNAMVVGHLDGPDTKSAAVATATYRI